MDELSAQAPLLSPRVRDYKHGYANNKLLLVFIAKWILKVVIWTIFVAWVALIFLYPTDFVGGLLRKVYKATSSTIFGITGSIFLIFSGPVLIICFLSVLYLHLLSAEGFQSHDKKTGKFPSFRLWTFPILVDGPFGVVSAAELIGILLFTVYILWAVSVYSIENLDLLSRFDVPYKYERNTCKEFQSVELVFYSLFPSVILVCMWPADRNQYIFVHSNSKISYNRGWSPYYFCSYIFFLSYLMLELTGLRFGIIGLFCLAFLFLPVARGSLLLRLIHIPFEHATRYHVWLGHLTMLIFTLHGVFYIVAWGMEGRLLREILEWKDIGIANLPGVISLLAGLLMWVTSFHPVRKHYFELFFYTHQLYIVFFVFLALHVGDFIFSIAAGGIFLFMLDRFLRFCQSRKTVGIISATCLPCGTVELVLSKPRNLQYNALSFFFLQVRELSWLQWHPFSVSSCPLDGEYHVCVLIKVLGEWTRKLRDNISSISLEPQKEFPSQPHSFITASVEGPYGHESAYHLKYENLVLVAGGIGVSPFLAILRDIFHHIEERKPCLTEKVLLVWAVKKSDELCLLSFSDMESICPFISDKLHLEIQIYVTQESDPPPVDEGGAVCKSMNCSYFPPVARSGMSGLVSTGNTTWAGIYVIISTIGFITLVAVMDSYYIIPFNVTSWWYKGLLFVALMAASVIIFGGLVVLFWYLRDRESSCEESMGNNKDSEKVQYNGQLVSTAAYRPTLATSTITHYGRRPDFGEIFNSISERWGHVDVGVIVCGPPSLQSSVAKECRSQNIGGRKNEPFFHFNSHSFDL